MRCEHYYVAEVEEDYYPQALSRGYAIRGTYQYRFVKSKLALIILLLISIVCASYLMWFFSHMIEKDIKFSPIPKPVVTDYSKNIIIKSSIGTIYKGIIFFENNPPINETQPVEKTYTVPNRSNVMSFDLTSSSRYSAKDYDNVLNGTGLEGLGKYYRQAEDLYGVNGVFLVGLSALESGWGESSLAKTKNNLFGFCAYDNNVSAAKNFTSKGESILAVAKYLSEHYLSSDGRYHSGNTLPDVNDRYASADHWGSSIGNIMVSTYNKLEKV